MYMQVQQVSRNYNLPQHQEMIDEPVGKEGEVVGRKENSKRAACWPVSRSNKNCSNCKQERHVAIRRLSAKCKASHFADKQRRVDTFNADR